MNVTRRPTAVVPFFFAPAPRGGRVRQPSSALPAVAYCPGMPYVLLLAAVAVNALANVLLKTASAKGVSWSLESGVFALAARNGLLLVALAVFAVNVLLYFAALRALPLSVAYPIMVAGTFVLVNGASALMLRESVAPMQLVGYLLIVAGVALVLAKKAVV